jgi:hypothetical protein
MMRYGPFVDESSAYEKVAIRDEVVAIPSAVRGIPFTCAVLGDLARRACIIDALLAFKGSVHGNNKCIAWQSIKQCFASNQQVELLSRPPLTQTENIGSVNPFYVYDGNRPLAPILRQRRCSLMYDVY